MSDQLYIVPAHVVALEITARDNDLPVRVYLTGGHAISISTAEAAQLIAKIQHLPGGIADLR